MYSMMLVWVLLFTTPAIGLTVEGEAVLVLNSDPRITDVRIHINDAVVLTPAPLHDIQSIPYSTPCGLSNLTVYGEVAGGELDGARFDFYQGAALHPCPVRISIPMATQ